MQNITRTPYLVFGADGQLGSALCDTREVVALDMKACDITDHLAVNAVFEECKPEVVINAAAYADVEKAEVEGRCDAYLVNVVGTLNLVKAAARFGSKFVFISTDYVFDGSKEGFAEDDKPRPLNVHGLSKLAAEQVVQSYCQSYLILRTSALFGPTPNKEGSQNFISKRVENIKAGKQLKMVSDQRTVPTYSYDLATAIFSLLEKKEEGIFHVVNNGGPTTWLDLTKDIAKAMGEKVEIESVSTSESNSSLVRPLQSILKAEKLKETGVELPEWQDRVFEYVKTLI